MKTLKILVTGSTGFVGSNIVEAFLKEIPPNEIVLFVRSKEKLKGLNIPKITETNIFSGDITKINDLEKALEFKPTAVIHSAALVDDWASIELLTEVNVQGTQNLVNAIKEISPTSHLVHISSTGVYPRITSVITEETPLSPFENYHKSKLESEKVITNAVTAKEISATILRPPNIMGLRDTTHMSKICQAVQNRKFPLINNGKAIQTWITGDDLAQAVFLTIKNQQKASGKIYNIKSFEITVKDLYSIIVKRLGVTHPPKTYNFHLAYSLGVLSEIIGKARGKPSTLNRYRVLKFARDRLFDDTKIREELNYQPMCTAEESVNRTIDWLLEANVIKICSQDKEAT